jgi:aryl-alcohol dehydrogenase-like predicted oxidoreductase
MEYRQLGNSGLRVSALSFGTGTFGGGDNEAFRSIGANDLAQATRVVDVCLDGGINLFDTADAYSEGQSEDILGKTLKGRRDKVLIATKAFFRMGPGENDIGGSRHHLIGACEASLRRLGTDYIDLYQVHCFDGLTPRKKH